MGTLSPVGLYEDLAIFTKFDEHELCHGVLERNRSALHSVVVWPSLKKEF